MSFLSIGLVALAVLVGAGVFYVQRHYLGGTYLTEYLFFARTSILSALVLIGLPLFGPSLAPGLLGNVFVVGLWGGFAASLAGLIAAWGIVFTARLVFWSTPARCGLFFLAFRQRQFDDMDRARKDEYLETIEAPVMSYAWYLLWGLLLTAALVYRMWRSSGAIVLLGFTLAIATAIALLLVGRRMKLLRMLDPIHTIIRSAAHLPEGVRWLHRSAARFFVITLVLYGALYFLGHPQLSSLDAETIPAIVYLLLTLTLFNWVASAIAFQFDRGRVPVLAFAIAFLFLLQTVLPTPHYFAVTQRADTASASDTEALVDWWRERGHPQSMLSVACSGGGITASYWTALVPQQLEQDPALQPFGRHVPLISSVSGGSVGAMLYVDGFREGATPADRMDTIVSKAGSSSLEAALWGVAYPELWRLLMPMAIQYEDRGWAMEQVWEKRLTTPGQTLADWLPGVRAGWRPLLIFNATLQETGERLVMSAARMNASANRMERTLAPESDIAVTTAARLSATFPFVSPQAQPDRDEALVGGEPYHAADGGYYDNSGVVAILETLDDLLRASIVRNHDELIVKRIGLIEIRAAPRYTLDIGEAAGPELPRRPDTPAKDGGVFNDLLGPLETLANVRSSSQVARNEFETRLMADVWRERYGVVLETFTFQLSPNQPLSWFLTEDEQATIKSHWPGLADEGHLAENEIFARRNATALARLRAFLSR